MTSLLAERLGAPRPRLLHLPPGKATSAGPEVVELAASAGLILDEWQSWSLEEGLAERADGKWAALESVLITPRQNGKDGGLEALELGALFLFEIGLTTHSAHEFKTAREHFLRIRALIEGAPELLERVAYIHTANGAESIGLKTGERLNFVARSKGSGRGFSGGLIILNEAMFLPEAAMGALVPTLSAHPNPQIWYTGSAPHADSHVLHGLRNRAQSGDAGRLFYAEWGNEPGIDVNNPEARREAIRIANPALGIRISEEFCDAEFDAIGHLGEEFARERLGIPSMEDTTAGIFPPGIWHGCSDLHSQAVPQALALDVSPGMTWASFAIAGTRTDGLTHVELLAREPGTGWVVDRARALAEELALPVLVDPRGPVAGLLDDLATANIKVELLADGQLPRACATLQERVLTGTVRHKGQSPLDQAVAGAGIRIQGDAWRWGRTASRVDISPLVAITIAAASGQPVAPSVELIVL
jgi:hypothetical protein